MQKTIAANHNRTLVAIRERLPQTISVRLLVRRMLSPCDELNLATLYALMSGPCFAQ
jgi:hypothetical protein